MGKRADYPRDYTMAKFVGGQVAKKVVATGAIDFRNPEAGYEPSTAARREDPIEANTYYDYTVWLRPTYYTVQAGHRLELYLVPFYGYSEYPDQEGRDYILEKNGLDASCLMNIRNDYTFTIDNGKSSASIPVTEGLRHRPVTYFAHAQGRGDLRVVADGITSGTAGEARRLEAISACVEGGSISYRSHVQGIGWTPWVNDGDICGTMGQSRRLEAIQMRLSEELVAQGYHVWYRVYSQTWGWLGWAHDGADAGTVGLARRAEAVEAQLLPQGQLPTGFDAGQPACLQDDARG